jgi:CRP-like cAMP-binding protein
VVVARELTVDQTPYRPDERARVQKCGARVLSYAQLEGTEPLHEQWGSTSASAGVQDPPRVWARSGDFPGTAFTRSIGDAQSKDFGIIGTPEVSTCALTPADRFFVLGTDGVFAFLDSQEVVDIVCGCGFTDPMQACRAVVAQAYSLWLQNEVYTDNLTMILVQFDAIDGGIPAEPSVQAPAAPPAAPSVGQIAAGHAGGGGGAAAGAHKSAPLSIVQVPIRMGPSQAQRRALGTVWNRSDSTFGPGGLTDEISQYDIKQHCVPKTTIELARIDAAVRGTAAFFFARLSAQQRADVISVIRKVEVNPGQWIIRQGAKGSSADCFYIIENGTFEVRVNPRGAALPESSPDPDPDDTEARLQSGPVVTTYTNSGMFGELALMYRRPRAATVIATSHGILWALDRLAYRAILTQASAAPSSAPVAAPSDGARLSTSIEASLRQVQVFRALPGAQLSTLASAARVVHVAAGNTIVEADAVCATPRACLYVLLTGSAHAWVPVDSRNSVGSIVKGMGSLFSGKKSSAAPPAASKSKTVLLNFGQYDYFGEEAVIGAGATATFSHSVHAGPAPDGGAGGAPSSSASQVTLLAIPREAFGFDAKLLQGQLAAAIRAQTKRRVATAMATKSELRLRMTASASSPGGKANPYKHKRGSIMVPASPGGGSSAAGLRSALASHSEAAAEAGAASAARAPPLAALQTADSAVLRAWVAGDASPAAADGLPAGGAGGQAANANWVPVAPLSEVQICVGVGALEREDYSRLALVQLPPDKSVVAFGFAGAPRNKRVSRRWSLGRAQSGFGLKSIGLAAAAAHDMQEAVSGSRKLWEIATSSADSDDDGGAGRPLSVIPKIVGSCVDQSCAHVLFYPAAGGDFSSLAMPQFFPAMPEQAAGGELLALGRQRESDARFYIGCALLGLQWLHAPPRRIVYRALAPELLLVGVDGYLQLADFRLAKQLATTASGGERAPRARTFTMCGTPEYLSPEQVNGSGHGAAADYWALGVLLYELLAGSSPFAGGSEMEVLARISSYGPRSQRLEYPEYFTPEVASLLDGLLQPEESTRLGAADDGEQLRAHPWLLTDAFSQEDWAALGEGTYPPPMLPQLIRIGVREEQGVFLVEAHASCRQWVQPRAAADFAGLQRRLEAHGMQMSSPPAPPSAESLQQYLEDIVQRLVAGGAQSQGASADGSVALLHAWVALREFLAWDQHTEEPGSGKLELPSRMRAVYSQSEGVAGWLQGF